jgi:hypothetical protein
MPEKAKKLTALPDRFAAGYLRALDGRTALAQDMLARWAAITDDLGGEASLSYAQRSLVERALWLEHFLAQQERALAEGRAEEFDPGRWTQGANTLLGLYRQLGIERRAKDVTDLQSYIRQRGVSA